MWAIIRTRFFEEKKKKIDFVDLSNTGWSEWSSRTSAQEWIKKEEDEVYYTSHGEYARPQYRIVLVGSDRFCDAHRQAFGGLEYQNA